MEEEAAPSVDPNRHLLREHAKMERRTLVKQGNELIKNTAYAKPFKGVHDYYNLMNERKELRQRMIGVKQHAHNYANYVGEKKQSPASEKRIKKFGGGLSLMRNIHHAAIEQQRAKSYKRAIGGIDGENKAVKHTLRAHAGDLAREYKHVADTVPTSKGSEERRTAALKALKHMDTNLDRRYSFTKVGAVSWLGKNGKGPETHKSLWKHVNLAKQSKKEAYQKVFRTLIETGSGPKVSTHSDSQ